MIRYCHCCNEGILNVIGDGRYRCNKCGTEFDQQGNALDKGKEPVGIKRQRQIREAKNA